MKKAFCVMSLAMVLLMLCACGDGQISSLPVSSELPTASIPIIIPIITSSQPPASRPAASVPASSTPAGPALSEAEALEISTGLYENGYLPFLALMWGGSRDETKSITIDGYNYNTSALYATLGDLETFLGNAFTEEFIQRNIAASQTSNGMVPPRLAVQDGVLYVSSHLGMGGTYQLSPETVSVSNLTETGWTFQIYGYDMWEDAVEENLTWEFTVVNENGGWCIDSMFGVFSDGSGRTEY